MAPLTTKKCEVSRTLGATSAYEVHVEGIVVARLERRLVSVTAFRRGYVAGWKKVGRWFILDPGGKRMDLRGEPKLWNDPNAHRTRDAAMATLCAFLGVQHGG